MYKLKYFIYRILSNIPNKKLRSKFLQKRDFYKQKLLPYIEKNINKHLNLIFNLALIAQQKTQNDNIDIEKVFSSYSVISGITADTLKYLFNSPEYLQGYHSIKHRPKYALIWGSASWEPQTDTVLYAINNNIPLLKMEDGFLRSADTYCNRSVDIKYRNGISFTITDSIHYFDATHQSRMEKLLNDKKLIITDIQKERARNCINKIIETNLTKYNHQPIYKPIIGRQGVKKILVVDQS